MIAGDQRHAQRYTGLGCQRKAHPEPLLAWQAGKCCSDPATGDPASRETLYLNHGCYSCHGYGGIGRRQLANDASAFLQDEVVFTTYLRLRANVESAGPSNSMPTYSAEVLSDRDAEDLFAYIRTLTDDPPVLEDIPVMMEILDAAQQGEGSD